MRSISHYRKVVRDWGTIAPLLLITILVAVIMVWPKNQNVPLFQDESERTALFSRFNKTFDPGRAHIVVSVGCLSAEEVAFLFPKEASLNPGDVGAPEMPMWGQLTVTPQNTPCGTFLARLKELRIPFYLYLATDTAIGEAIAILVRKRTGRDEYPRILVGGELISLSDVEALPEFLKTAK